MQVPPLESEQMGLRADRAALLDRRLDPDVTHSVVAGRVPRLRDTALPDADPDEDRATYVARWNASHWPDTFERMLERRRRALDQLDAIRARTKPPSGPHATVDAILDAVREELGARLLDYLPSRDSVP